METGTNAEENLWSGTNARMPSQARMEKTNGRMMVEWIPAFLSDHSFLCGMIWIASPLRD
ncbi:MAG: hypothetical protein KJ626_03020 [Verrucomicrobia bacterium]|nr:hypothetical protein [Verrucomicrobiota bacterium]